MTACATSCPRLWRGWWDKIHFRLCEAFWLACNLPDHVLFDKAYAYIKEYYWEPSCEVNSRMSWAIDLRREGPLGVLFHTLSVATLQ